MATGKGGVPPGELMTHPADMPPTTPLCWSMSTLDQQTRCDRMKGHLGLCSWQWAILEDAWSKAQADPIMAASTWFQETVAQFKGLSDELTNGQQP